jgi:16S rRNA processing protein RimM
VLGAWGAHGALRLEPLTDFPDRFATGAHLWVDGERRKIEHSHWLRGTPVLKLAGIDGRETAAALQGSLAEIPEAELHALAEDEYFQHDLIGLRVFDAGGVSLGSVTALLPTGANDVLVVEGEAGQYLLPLIEDVVKQVSLANGTITVELLAGLEPEAPKTSKARAARRPPRPPAPAIVPEEADK